MSNSKTAKNKKSSSPVMVRIPEPEEFLDIDDEPWSWRLTSGEWAEDVSLREVLKFTIRNLKVKNGEDAERTLDLIMSLKETDEGDIFMRKADFDWMTTQFKLMGHGIWKAPDSAYLIRVLNESVESYMPDTDTDTDTEPAELAEPATN